MTMHSKGRRWRRVTAPACVLIAIVWVGRVADAQQMRAVTDGVYTQEQAARGQTLYRDKCASCHGAMLDGAQGPALSGEAFLTVWSGPVSELAGKIQHTMPANEPGKLTRPQTADLVAYILQVAKFPAGRGELAA